MLAAIQARPDGVQRAGLAHLGSPGAIHSALKQHKARGFITNKDGRWVAKTSGGAPVKKKGPEAP